MCTEVHQAFLEILVKNQQNYERDAVTMRNIFMLLDQL